MGWLGQVFLWLGQSFVQLFLGWQFWLLVFLTGLIHYGQTRDPVEAGSLTVSSLGAGLGGGLLGTLLLIMAGITVDAHTCGLLLPTALGLMLLRPRFICFAYAGGLLSLSHWLLGFPQVDVPQLMGLVGVLHCVEAALVRFTGTQNCRPRLLPDKEGGWVRGYEMGKLWPLPLVALLAAYVSPQALQQGFREMPDWWPLIPALTGGQAAEHLTAAGGQLLYSLTPVMAVLGYHEVFTGQTPLQRAKATSRRLLVYSLCLLGLCRMAGDDSRLIFVPALFGPLGHELILWLDRQAGLSRRSVLKMVDKYGRIEK